MLKESFGALSTPRLRLHFQALFKVKASCRMRSAPKSKTEPKPKPETKPLEKALGFYKLLNSLSNKT